MAGTFAAPAFASFVSELCYHKSKGKMNGMSAGAPRKCIRGPVAGSGPVRGLGFA